MIPKSPFDRTGMINAARTAMAPHLLSGARYTAQELQDLIGVGYLIWETLNYLEREGQVYRAPVHGDWRTFNDWRITGCGRIAALTP